MQLQRHWARMDGQEGGQWWFVEDDATQRCQRSSPCHLTERFPKPGDCFVFLEDPPEIDLCQNSTRTVNLRLRDLYHMVKKTVCGGFFGTW